MASATPSGPGKAHHLGRARPARAWSRRRRRARAAARAAARRTPAARATDIARQRPGEEVPGRVEQEQADQPGQQDAPRSGPRTRRRASVPTELVSRSCGRASRTRAPSTDQTTATAPSTRPTCPRLLAQHQTAEAASTSPGSATGRRSRCRRGPLGIGVRHVEPHRHDQADDGDEHWDVRRHRGGDGRDGGRRAHASSITAGRPAVRGPKSLRRRDDHEGTGAGPLSLRAGASGRRVFRHAADRGPTPPHRTGVTTVTIQHSPAPARSDVATAAPAPHEPATAPSCCTAGCSPPAPSPGRPRPWPWSASTPRATVRRWRSRSSSGLFQVGLLFLLRTLWRTQALGEGRLARAVLRFEAVAVGLAIGLHAQSTASALTDLTSRLRSCSTPSGRCRCSACSSSASASRSPADGRA